ncbi:MAG: PLD nuclease N-terminal domain-containing protein [Rhodoglobus sp.]
MFQLLLSVVLLGATIFALIDVITSDQSQIRYLDKIIWVILIVLVPLVGVIVWFVVGKERGATSDGVVGRAGRTTQPSSFNRPARAEPSPQLPMSDEDIDAAVEREVEFHERQARIRRLEAEVKARRDEQPNA